MKNNSEKYECEICGSKVTNNPNNITKHNKTQKHMKALETGFKPQNKEDDKAVAQKKRMREYRAKLKAELGEEKYKEKAKIAKQNYRAKTVSDKVPEITEEPVLFSAEQEEKAIAKAKNLSLKNKKEFCNEIFDVLEKTKKNQSDVEPKEIKKKMKDNIKAQKININNEDTLNQLIDKIDKTNLTKKSLKIDTSTLKTYFTNINRLYKQMFDKQWDLNFKWLDDSKKVINFVNSHYKSDSNRLNYIKSIVAILSRLNGFDELNKKYKNEQMRLVYLLKNEAGKNKLTVREEKNWLDWTDLVDITDFDTDEDAFLHALYTSIPPRRLEYKYLKFFQLKKNKKKKAEDLDKKFNWIVFNTKGTPSKLVFNKYKTSKTYRQQVFDISGTDKKPIFDFTKLRKSAKAFVLSSGLDDEDLCFPNSNGQLYENFSRRVSEYPFRKFYKQGKNISVNILRHSFISHYNTRGKNLNTNSMREVSRWMSHSLEEALIYRKIIDPNSPLLAVIQEDAKN